VGRALAGLEGDARLAAAGTQHKGEATTAKRGVQLTPHMNVQSDALLEFLPDILEFQADTYPSRASDAFCYRRCIRWRRFCFVGTHKLSRVLTGTHGVLTDTHGRW
jgi:hypothetical protein